VAEASPASLGTSLVYGLRTLGILLRFRLDRSGRLRWLVLRRPAARLEPWQPESTAAATPVESTPLGA